MADGPETPSFVPTGEVAGPTDRGTTLFAALASFALGLLTLLAVVLSWQGSDTPFVIALVVTAVLLVASAVFATASGATRIRARVVGSTGRRSTT